MRGGVSAEGTKGGEVSMYLSAPLMQTAGRVPASSFACYSPVQVGAGGKRGCCCECKGTQMREAGEKSGGCAFNLGPVVM